MTSSEDDPKPVDVDALIEAKRQRMAQGSQAQKDAEAKAQEAAEESARRAAEEQAKKQQPKREEIYDRLAREAVYKKQSAALLAQVTLVPIDENEDETEDELMPSGPAGPRRSSRRKKKRSRGSRALRRSGSGARPRGGSNDSTIGIVMALLGILLVGGILILVLSSN